MRNEICKLVKIEKTIDDEGFEIEQETEVEVFCEIKSIGRSEFYQAANAGVKVSLLVNIDADDYEANGEPMRVNLKGKCYKVVRTYKKVGTEMELTLQEVE